MKIGIMYIGIGKYAAFWDDFYSSAEQMFFPGIEKHYYFFTDHTEIYSKDNVDIIPEKNYGWPGNTLYRFRMFSSLGERLLDYDYVFFFNANAMFVEKVENEILPLGNEKIICVGHFDYFKKDPILYNGYERNKKSTAYVKWGEEGSDFCQACFIGATSEEFLKMSKELSNNILIDESNHLCAIWHDESHFNKYIISRPYKILDLSYAYGESIRPDGYTPKILMRNKERLGEINSLRGNKKNIMKSFFVKLNNQFIKFDKRMHYFWIRKILKK